MDVHRLQQRSYKVHKPGPLGFHPSLLSTSTRAWPTFVFQQEMISPLKSTNPVKALKLPKRVTGLSNELLYQHIRTQAIDFYNDRCKDGSAFFVVVLVLNPLDSLGDDQVREKKIIKIKAINLTKMMLNREVIQKIKRGYFGFVYLSPEVFLDNNLFTEMFFSHEFQKILSLMVIDKAHMIYLWGLVTSRASKGMATFTQHEDCGPFCIAYGSIDTTLMTTNNVPVLMLSATCQSIAVLLILSSLRLQPSNVTMIDDELTRPEIRIIRIPLKFTLKSCDDLLRIYAPHSKVPAEKAIPMLIYSTSRNLTFQVMKIVNEA
ncbi:hypothetical protein PSTG_07469 [Puccinia striiformis f. sp. tritici PST-78]|uniref:DNA 3'-5' helicase n=1 Tax=Puccinia striiformis f. sp. tritici PST-78 TaxID=1165861 RepID=A0A0L0VJG3_9BASI|nr:hypothetical protein PSTG_07469 [Puccinia striiformis f. sp. tritici PST-78]